MAFGASGRSMDETDPPPRQRRPRYPGRNPRKFHEKYKELSPERYASDIQKVIQSGKTPAGMHRSIMIEEVLAAGEKVAVSGSFKLREAVLVGVANEAPTPGSGGGSGKDARL